MDKRPLIKLIEGRYDTSSLDPELCCFHVGMLYSRVCDNIECNDCITNGLKHMEEIVRWIQEL